MSSGIGRDEILGLEAYERSRGYIRRRAIEARGARRVVIGPSASLVFENRETLRYQIQEMLRAERIVDPDAIAHEIETYSELLPRPDELSATLFFEFPDPATRAQELEKMAGVERHVWLVIGEDRIAGQFDLRQLEEERVSAVQFVRFPLEGKQLEALSGGAPARIAIDHPRYQHEADVPPSTVAAVLSDLADMRPPAH
ncbi:MAG TPA: DUF3501 family protein [Kofleriaceae bacterium]|nr:DUF3501 family protein [Kofleriaceae bacterium]